MAHLDIFLRQVWERGLGDPSHFEADVQVGEKEDDHFYALIYDKFWDTMLPALERVRYFSIPISKCVAVAERHACCKQLREASVTPGYNCTCDSPKAQTNLSFPVTHSDSIPIRSLDSAVTSGPAFVLWAMLTFNENDSILGARRRITKKGSSYSEHFPSKLKTRHLTMISNIHVFVVNPPYARTSGVGEGRRGTQRRGELFRLR